jgi:sugar phosphate isomerase/epimerase
VLDTKQALRSGVSIEEMRRAMGEGLRHVHISDCSAQKDCVLPGRGQLDIAGFSRLLSGSGYQGDVMLEVYRDSYDEVQELFSSYRYLAGQMRQGEEVF